jgi:serine/threonine protein kinase
MPTPSPRQVTQLLLAWSNGDQAAQEHLMTLADGDPRRLAKCHMGREEVAAKMIGEYQSRPLVGQRVGPYQILSLLGVGGMGEVYLAQDPRLGHEVALKILPAEVAADPDRLRHFQREARAASTLKHPNVAHIYDIGESDGTNFIAMEYVEGQTLDARINGHPNSPLSARTGEMLGMTSLSPDERTL